MQDEEDKLDISSDAERELRQDSFGKP